MSWSNEESKDAYLKKYMNYKVSTFFAKEPAVKDGISCIQQQQVETSGMRFKY